MHLSGPWPPQQGPPQSGPRQRRGPQIRARSHRRVREGCRRRRGEFLRNRRTGARRGRGGGDRGAEEAEESCGGLLLVREDFQGPGRLGCSLSILLWWLHVGPFFVPYIKVIE